MEKVDIKNTKEALTAFLDLLPILVTKFKDGVQVDDFVKLAVKINGDAQLQQKLMAAYNGAELIPTEIGDLDMTEVLEIAMLFIQKVPAVLEALKAEKPAA